MNPIETANLARFERTTLNESLFKCSKCPETYTYENHKLHMKVCKANQILCPAKCSEINFSQPNKLRDHLDTGCPRIIYTCDCCDDPVLIVRKKSFVCKKKQ